MIRTKTHFGMIIFISGLLLGCWQSGRGDKIVGGESKNGAMNTFSAYSSRIPMVSLPLNSTCDKELVGSTFGITDSLIKKFAPDNTLIYRKILEDKQYTAIIYLYPGDQVLPIIWTMDKNGNKISELPLGGGFCGEDETTRGTSRFVITKDLIIQLTDSSVTFGRDKKARIIERSKRIHVLRKEYRINRNGKIVQIGIDTKKSTCSIRKAEIWK